MAVADSIRWWIDAMFRDISMVGGFDRAMDVHIPLMEKEIRRQIYEELEGCEGDWSEKAECLLGIQ